MVGKDKFKVGDRVVMARPTEVHEDNGVVKGAAGTVTRVDGDGTPGITFDSGLNMFISDDRLAPAASAVPKRDDDRRERIATAVLAGFAADPNNSHLLVRDLAKAAGDWADALIKELDR